MNTPGGFVIPCSFLGGANRSRCLYNIYIYIIPNIFNLIHNRIITNLHESSLLKNTTLYTPPQKKTWTFSVIFSTTKKRKEKIVTPILTNKISFIPPGQVQNGVKAQRFLYLDPVKTSTTMARISWIFLTQPSFGPMMIPMALSVE